MRLMFKLVRSEGSNVGSLENVLGNVSVAKCNNAHRGC